MRPPTSSHNKAYSQARPPRPVEAFKPGYPRFTALLSQHEPFFIFRRFSRLRARLLLLKQDGLAHLEKRLDEVDEQETTPLYLGSSQHDRNAQRATLLSEIEARLADYDELAERTRQVLSLTFPEHRDVQSLRAWLDGNRSLVREAVAYLDNDNDLACFAPFTDKGALRLESWVEDKCIRWYQGFRNSLSYDVSTDPCVYLYSGTLVPRIAKALQFLLIVLPLLIPIVLCNSTTRSSVRLVIIMASVLAYLCVASSMTKSRTMELIVAAATYTTIFTVFVAGPAESKA